MFNYCNLTALSADTPSASQANKRPDIYVAMMESIERAVDT